MKDNMLCLNSDEIEDGEELIGSDLNFESGTRHILEIAINDKIE